MPYQVKAILLHEPAQQPEVVIWATASLDHPDTDDDILKWPTEEEAVEWMNGPEGDTFADCVTLDSKSMEGYYVDEIVAIRVPYLPMPNDTFEDKTVIAST